MRDPRDEQDADALIGASSRRPLRPEEYPDEDFDADNGDDTEPCPHCGKPIYTDGDWCPKCGQWLSPGRSGLLPMWAVLAAVLVIVGFLLMVLLAR